MPRGRKYAKLLIMSGLHSVTQRSEYARICLDKVLNISWVANRPGF